MIHEERLTELNVHGWVRQRLPEGQDNCLLIADGVNTKAEEKLFSKLKDNMTLSSGVKFRKEKKKNSS